MDFEKIKEAVTSIEMSKAMEDRIKQNMAKKKSGLGNYKRWISVTCVFGILLSIIISTSFINKNGNFTITAYASSDDGNQRNTKISSDKVTFTLSTEDRIDGGLISVSGGANLIFTDVRMEITGEYIESITYAVSEGTLVEDVTFTSKEYVDTDWLESEKINFITTEPSSGIFQGIKEIGNTYTVQYNEQDQHEYTLAIPHNGNSVLADDIIMEVVVNYTDGNSEQQDIMVTQESDSISLKLH